jgi:hypothetical protein
MIYNEFASTFFFLDEKETKNQACSEIKPEFCPPKAKILLSRFAPIEFLRL